MMKNAQGGISIISVHTELPSQRLKRPKSMLSWYNYWEHQKDSKLQISIELICEKPLIKLKYAHIKPIWLIGHENMHCRGLYSVSIALIYLRVYHAIYSKHGDEIGWIKIKEDLISETFIANVLKTETSYIKGLEGIHHT